jgi:hypothetical protein
MKSIHDYHLSDGALLSDIKPSLYQAPLQRGQLYIASNTLLKTIQRHLDELKSEYGIPYETVVTPGGVESAHPMSYYHALWKATQQYRVDDQGRPVVPFVLIHGPKLDEDNFPYWMIRKTLDKDDSFLDGENLLYSMEKGEFEKAVERYNLYHATSLPTTFVSKCNIIIVTGEDLSWAPEEFVDTHPGAKKLLVLPNGDNDAEMKAHIELIKAREDRRELHYRRVNPKGIKYQARNSLLEKATKCWYLPDYVENVGNEPSMDAYAIFNTDAGRVVLTDLERIALQTKIDANAPNASAAVWKCAQLAIIQRVRNRLAEITSVPPAATKRVQDMLDRKIGRKLDEYEELCGILNKTEHHMPIPEIIRLKSLHRELQMDTHYGTKERWLAIKKQWGEHPFIVAALSWQE